MAKVRLLLYYSAVDYSIRTLLLALLHNWYAR